MVTFPQFEHPDLRAVFEDPGADPRSFLRHPVNSDAFLEALSERHPGPCHQVGGYATPVQGPVEYEATANADQPIRVRQRPRLRTPDRRGPVVIVPHGHGHESVADVKIYTRKGDAGQTSIWGGRRVSKDEIRVEALGAVDECNAAVGAAAACELPQSVVGTLIGVQESLYAVNCELMAPERTGAAAKLPRLAAADVTRLESVMDDIDGLLPELSGFVHPGGTAGAAALHVARAACRRAERRVTTLRRSEAVSDEVAAYLNRLADLLFVLARYVNHEAGIPDARWDRHAWQRGRAAQRDTMRP